MVGSTNAQFIYNKAHADKSTYVVQKKQPVLSFSQEKLKALYSDLLTFLQQLFGEVLSAAQAIMQL